MLRVDGPDPAHFSGEQLIRELHTAGYHQVDVLQEDGDLRITGKTESGTDIDERSRSRVEAIVAAHHYTPTEQRLAELEAWKAAVEKLPVFKGLR